MNYRCPRCSTHARLVEENKARLRYIRYFAFRARRQVPTHGKTKHLWNMTAGLTWSSTIPARAAAQGQNGHSVKSQRPSNNPLCVLESCNHH